MRKLLLGLGGLWAVLALAVMLSPSAQAIGFSSLSNFSMEERKADAKYTVGTSMWNPRVYEFTPKTDRTTLCVLVFGNSDDKRSDMQMQCFKKGNGRR